MQRVRGLVAATMVGVPVTLFLLATLHATREFGIFIGCVVGLGIFMVVSTGTDAHDGRADAAWREAAGDLPPASDRVLLEQTQAHMPGPEKPRRRSGPQRNGHLVAPSGAPVQGAETK